MHSVPHRLSAFLLTLGMALLPADGFARQTSEPVVVSAERIERLSASATASTVGFDELVVGMPHGVFQSAFQTGSPSTLEPRSNKATGVARVRQDAFDVSFYHLNLNLDRLRDPELMGHVRVSGQATASIDTVDLDLDANMEVMIVLASDGRSLSWEHSPIQSPNKLFIVPEGGLEAGQQVGFDIVYRGNPEWDDSAGGYASGERHEGDEFIWTLSEPYGASAWWPTEDHPVDKADSVRVTLTVPSHMMAASNGLLESEVAHENGTTTFDWMHRYPIATYLVSIAAGEYDRHVDVYDRPFDLAQEFGSARFPIENYAFRDIPAVEGINAASGWRLTPHAMAIQERWFGPYPFADEKYGNAHVTFRGGMEHQTLSSMGNIGIELIAHELAHQWYGNAVTPASWRDLWLNEGFATLGEMLTFEADTDFTPVRDILFDIYYSRALTAEGSLVLADTSDASDMFTHGRVYAKGWMVLRMIRKQVGDPAFRSILRAWAEAPEVRYGNGTTEQFKHVVESVTGQDWSVFFEQWVTEGAGEPRWRMAWEDISQGSNHALRVELDQIQTGTESSVQAFQVQLPLWVESDHFTYEVLVDVSDRTQVIDIPLPARPIGVQVDPERWILRGETAVISGTDVEWVSPPEWEVVVAPHPAQPGGPITIRVPSLGQARGHDAIQSAGSAVLFDMMGRRVWHTELAVGRTEYRLSVPEVAAGRYLLRVRAGRMVNEQLIIVQ